MLEIVREADAVLVAEKMCQNINKRIGAILETVADRYVPSGWQVRMRYRVSMRPDKLGSPTPYTSCKSPGGWASLGAAVNIHSLDADA